MPAVELLSGLRVVSTPAALDGAAWPPGATILRLAPDEALAVGARHVDISDSNALVEVETGLCGVELSPSALVEWMQREAEWAPPAAGFGQGMAAGLPVKVWLGDGSALVVTSASLASELEDRL